MRSRCALLTLLATSATALAAAGAVASAPVPGSDCVWAQPGTALVAGLPQPAAWIPISTPVLRAPVRGCDYVWAQPGTGLVDVEYGQQPLRRPRTSV